MLKVLVATKRTQGERSNDFCHATEGELVTFATECDGEAVDGRCGCRRSMLGMQSMKATTTFAVVEKDITIEQFKAEVLDYFRSSGWGKCLDEKTMLKEAEDLLEMAKDFPLGAVLEKRGNKFQTRMSSNPAVIAIKQKMEAAGFKIGDKVWTSYKTSTGANAMAEGVIKEKKGVVGVWVAIFRRQLPLFHDSLNWQKA